MAPMTNSAPHPTSCTDGSSCTVVVAADMVRCGKPPVYTFVASNGIDIFAECADHHIVPEIPEPAFVTVGSRVMVPHCGVVKQGTVMIVGPVNARVMVPIYLGTNRESTKVITVPIANCAPVPFA